MESLLMNGKAAEDATSAKIRAKRHVRDARQATTGTTVYGMKKRRKMMILNDFLNILDTQEPVMVYLDGCEDKEYKSDEMPEWYKDLELTDVYVDEEGIGVAIYTA